ncbi:BatD family protein [Capnocytophaga canimorsus]|uniref:BatD family protein n=1 Tax=Capnocytophaga canimorsus TaxID=28188 RepID=UPI001E4754FE|nr:BatD family protein [Capnocytophaga canimorsus]
MTTSKKINIFLFLLLWIQLGYTQNPQIKVEVNPTEIKIGEQIEFKISVEANQTEGNVVFPQGQTFIPLEMVRASAVDTLLQQEKIRLMKTYYLTQFDSGSYTIPRQKIEVNSKSYYTDSLWVQVRNIPVDTLKQPLYDIKPIMGVEKSSSFPYQFLFFVFGWLAVLLISILLVLLRKKKRGFWFKKTPLPPFEKAILGLKNLQNSKYLIESKHKEYYSELTDIVREYLEDEVRILAKESTTDELLGKIELLQESGKLSLSSETITNLRSVLQTADLVKFAKNKPDDNTAENHRVVIEDVVKKTKAAIPEPTLEEKLQNQEFLKEMELQKRQRQKRMLRWAIGLFSLLVLGGTATYLGYNSFKDTLLSDQTTQLLKGRWVTSAYGYPQTQITTPEVLKRQKMYQISGFEQMISQQHVFDFGAINSNLYIMTSVIVFRSDAQGQEQTTLNPEKVNNIVLSQLEKAGGQNITTLSEEYTTTQGVKGLKLFGKMTIKDRRGNPFTASYELYSFTENGALQQLLITYKESDKSAREIAQKVVYSIDFKRD